MQTVKVKIYKWGDKRLLWTSELTEFATFLAVEVPRSDLVEDIISMDSDFIANDGLTSFALAINLIILAKYYDMLNVFASQYSYQQESN